MVASVVFKSMAFGSDEWRRRNIGLAFNKRSRRSERGGCSDGGRTLEIFVALLRWLNESLSGIRIARSQFRCQNIYRVVVQGRSPAQIETPTSSVVVQKEKPQSNNQINIFTSKSIFHLKEQLKLLTFTDMCVY